MMLKALGEYGRIRQYMSSLVGVLFGILFAAVGMWMETRRVRYDVEVSADVKSVGRCSIVQKLPRNNSSTPTRNYSCAGVSVEYMDPEGVVHKPGPMMVQSGRALTPGDTITLYLNRKKYSDFSQQSDNMRMVGILFICGGLVSIAVSVGSAYLVSKSDIAADVSGAEGIASAVGNIL